MKPPSPQNRSPGASGEPARGIPENGRFGRSIASNTAASQRDQPPLPVVVARLPKNAADTVVIQLVEYRGFDLVDLRIFNRRDDPRDEPQPTKKGIALRTELLPALIRALQAAESEARRRGLIDDEAAK